MTSNRCQGRDHSALITQKASVSQGNADHPPRRGRSQYSRSRHEESQLDGVLHALCDGQLAEPRETYRRHDRSLRTV